MICFSIFRFFLISSIFLKKSNNLFFSNLLKAHALNIGDAAKVPLGKPVSKPVKIENLDLDQIQQNLTNSIKRPKTGIKMDQADSALSIETILDVKSQQLRGTKNFRKNSINCRIYKKNEISIMRILPEKILGISHKKLEN